MAWRQPIIWTNDGLVYWHIQESCASLVWPQSWPLICLITCTYNDADLLLSINHSVTSVFINITCIIYHDMLYYRTAWYITAAGTTHHRENHSHSLKHLCSFNSMHIWNIYHLHQQSVGYLPLTWHGIWISYRHYIYNNQWFAKIKNMYGIMFVIRNSIPPYYESMVHRMASLDLLFFLLALVYLGYGAGGRTLLW